MRANVMGRITILLLGFAVGMSIAYAQEQATKSDKIGSDIVAIVNDTQITIKELFERLYRLNGIQVLNQMINEILILDEAKKQKIEVGMEEINAEIDKIKSQFKDEDAFNNQLSARRMR
jgi:hypothetical protein